MRGSSGLNRVKVLKARDLNPKLFRIKYLGILPPNEKDGATFDSQSLIPQSLI